MSISATVLELFWKNQEGGGADCAPPAGRELKDQQIIFSQRSFTNLWGQLSSNNEAIPEKKNSLGSYVTYGPALIWVMLPLNTCTCPHLSTVISLCLDSCLKPLPHTRAQCPLPGTISGNASRAAAIYTFTVQFVHVLVLFNDDKQCPRHANSVGRVKLCWICK